MKKSNLLFTSLIIVSLSVFMACENSSQKMERAENPIAKSDRNVDMSESKVLAEVRMFRFKTANEIKANFRKIAAIKDKIKTSDESLRENYEVNLEVLDEANREMKRTIDNFTESGRGEWTTFKDEFSDSMDGLANSLDNFFDASNTNSLK
ncbi:MAG: hypothetical protein U5K72_13815 [Balneolaceae bacterium]|nr:hypothetical protein [Balneolaceae bacterium]